MLTLSAGYTLWGTGGFKYQSLNQGSLGDCWFLAGMISLGHADPNFIKNLFLTPEVNSSRIFGVNFHDLGV